MAGGAFDNRLLQFLLKAGQWRPETGCDQHRGAVRVR